MKLRSITVNDKEYLWRVYSPNGDGDGGIGVKIWRDKKVVKDAFFQWGRVYPVTPEIIKRFIKNELTEREIGCAFFRSNKQGSSL